MTTMTTTEAGNLLGISRVSVTVLADHGELTVVGRVGNSLVLDSDSVHRVARQRSRRGRPLDTPTAWAAVAILSGAAAPWLGVSQRSRLKGRLRNVCADQFCWIARRRATDHSFRVSASYLSDVQAALMPSGVGDVMREDVNFGLAEDRNRAEGYTDTQGMQELLDAYHMVKDPAGNVILHEVTFPAAFTLGSSAALTAVDLAASLDVRERSSGLRVLEELLEQHKKTSQ